MTLLEGIPFALHIGTHVKKRNNTVIPADVRRTGVKTLAVAGTQVPQTRATFFAISRAQKKPPGPGPGGFLKFGYLNA